MSLPKTWFLALMIGFTLFACRTANSQIRDAGTGSTVGGDEARGAGIYLQGLGSWELNNAKALNLNAATMMKIDQWNREMNAAYRKEYNDTVESEMRKRRIKDSEKREYLSRREQQLRSEPLRDDITRGDALNVLLTDLSDTTISDSAWRNARVELPPDLPMEKLIFRFAPKAGNKASRSLGDGVIALARMDLKEDNLPVALRGSGLANERQKYEAAYRKIREKCAAAKLEPDDAVELITAVQALKIKVNAVVTKDLGFRVSANRYVAQMEIAARMFSGETVDYAQDMIRDTQLHQAKTVADVLAFMRKYRLVIANTEAIPEGGEVNQRFWELLKKQAEALELKPGQGLAGVAPSMQDDNPVVMFDTTAGLIMIKLDRAKAPRSVENFLKYVDMRFYDGMVFHRVVRNLVVQAGGMQEMGGVLRERKNGTLPYIRNESGNGLSNVRGTIAMARTADPDSATSQFFINTSNNSKFDTLGGGYAVFGKVIEGMEVVDAISRSETTTRMDETGTTHKDVPKDQIRITRVRRKPNP